MDWLVSEKSKTNVKQYAEYSERAENEVIDFFLTNILLDEDFITWIKKKCNNKRLLTLLGIEDPSDGHWLKYLKQHRVNIYVLGTKEAGVFMGCISYIYGEGDHSSKQIQKLVSFSTQFDLHISPWIFDRNEERKNLNQLLVNPQSYDMKLFITTSLDNLGDSLPDSINVIMNLVEQNIQVISLKDNIDTTTKEGLEEFIFWVDELKSEPSE